MGAIVQLTIISVKRQTIVLRKRLLSARALGGGLATAALADVMFDRPWEADLSQIGSMMRCSGIMPFQLIRMIAAPGKSREYTGVDRKLKSFQPVVNKGQSTAYWAQEPRHRQSVNYCRSRGGRGSLSLTISTGDLTIGEAHRQHLFTGNK